MPNFKQFIKGFEEPEAQPKAQEVETEKPKVEESEFSKSRPAFTHDFAESLRKDAINWANEKLPHDKSLPKILNNYTRDEVIDFMRGNIGEDEIMKRAKERNGINQDRVNLLAKQETPNPTEVMKNADAKYKPMFEELDKKDNELYKAYYYEKDPVKKAEYKAQMEENSKKIDALLEEWQKATKPAPKPGSFGKMIEGFDEPQTKEEAQEIDADWERSYGPMRFDDWTDIDQLKAMFAKADNGGASETAENALERLEELGAVAPGTYDRFVSGEKIDINAKPQPEQKQFSKEEIALADKTADVLSHYAWGQGFKVEKLPNGNYLTNLHLNDPDAEPQEVGPDFMLQEREKLLKSGDERFAELWEEYNK